jgi:hypothetical protein
MTWIKCTERLPEKDEHVLVFNEEYGVFRAYCDGHEKYPSWQCYPIGSYAGDGCVYEVTYWMPLPGPPNIDTRLVTHWQEIPS